MINYVDCEITLSPSINQLPIQRILSEAGATVYVGDDCDEKLYVLDVPDDLLNTIDGIESHQLIEGPW